MGDVRREGHVAEEEEDAIERAVDVRDGDMSEVGGKVVGDGELAEDDGEWHGLVVIGRVGSQPSRIDVASKRAKGLMSGSHSLHSEQVVALWSW